jgi:hypothetical protein
MGIIFQEFTSFKIMNENDSQLPFYKLFSTNPKRFVSQTLTIIL